MTMLEVEAVIGKPTLKFNNIRLYSHEHLLTLNGEPYSADNEVFIRYDNDTVHLCACRAVGRQTGTLANFRLSPVYFRMGGNWGVA
jgi:hypothetical protein